ncbi:MAG: hypothetical protein HeimC2_31730 [Candidatus Heimdallarchaeota archaeon LC_2]|nr:MAG: hypothetical protein HeimC2_31730 [Candidatus Heimdallarchaeota archaeon LC_2]
MIISFKIFKHNKSRKCDTCIIEYNEKSKAIVKIVVNEKRDFYLCRAHYEQKTIIDVYELM